MNMFSRIALVNSIELLSTVDKQSCKDWLIEYRGSECTSVHELRQTIVLKCRTNTANVHWSVSWHFNMATLHVYCIIFEYILDFDCTTTVITARTNNHQPPHPLNYVTLIVQTAPPLTLSFLSKKNWVLALECTCTSCTSWLRLRVDL